jgi:integrase
VIVQHQLGHKSSVTTREFYIRRPNEAMQDQFATAFD